MQHHLAATRAHALHLDLRCRFRHHDGRFNAQHFGRQRQPLRMVAGRGGDYATGLLFGRKLRQLVVSPANLERVHRLQVFTLEQNLIAQTLGQLIGDVQRGFHRHVVDARGEDFFDVLFEHGGHRRRKSGECASLPQGCVDRPHKVPGFPAHIRWRCSRAIIRAFPLFPRQAP